MITVLAPLSGVVLALQDVPDPVFAEQMVGPGLAIDPLAAVLPGRRADVDADVDADARAGADGSAPVLAPVHGRVASLFPHAFAIERDDGRAVLVHLGIDTVEVADEGFTGHVEVGAEVTAGQLLVTWAPRAVAAGGRSVISPVVALQAAPDDVRPAVPLGATVTAGDVLLHWV